MKNFLLFFYISLTLLNTKVSAMEEDILEEKVRSLCNQFVKGPYRNPEGDEDELQRAIAFKILEADPCIDHALLQLLEYISNPPLRYSLLTYDEEWDDFVKRNNIQNPIENLKSTYWKKLKLEEKYFYLRNIFLKIFEDQFVPVAFHFPLGQDIFEACLQEHQKKMNDIQECDLDDVAFYDKEAIVFGLPKFYSFLMQHAIECKTELKALNDLLAINSLISIKFNREN